jgi:DNA-binding GntR family transcriptional regulator
VPRQPGESLRTQAYASIKNDILMGVYGMGEQLSVEELGKKCQVSKTPIRDALHLLQVEGLVEVVPRVGYFTTRCTVKEIQDLFELRIVLEAASARLAARRITDYQLAYLSSLGATYTPRDPSTYMNWIRYNREFHCTIAASSGNDELAQAIGHVIDRLQRAQWLRLDLPPTPEAARELHRHIVEALKKADPPSAEQAMIMDITESRDAAMRKILERPDEWPV